MEQDIKTFIYIDNEGIDSLYYQLSDMIIPTKITTTKYTDARLSSDLRIGFLKSLSAKLRSDLKTKNQIQEERQEKVTVENKIDVILNNLNDGKIDRLFDILKNCNYEGLVACKSLFRFISAYDEDEKRQVLQSEINRNPFKYKHLSFIFASTPYLQFYSNDVDVFKHSLDSEEYYVDMYFSGSKLVRNVRHLTNNIKYGKDFIFYVLGEITCQGNGIFCIKPYAIWKTNNTNL